MPGASGTAEEAAQFAHEVERWIDADTLAGHLHTDGELLAGEFNVATAEALREGGPWGSGFPEPMFDGEFGVAGPHGLPAARLHELQHGATVPRALGTARSLAVAFTGLPAGEAWSLRDILEAAVSTGELAASTR